MQSRYYNPHVGIFLNADGYISTGQGVLSYNMFAYCLNNPAKYVDINGTNPEDAVAWTSTMWWLCALDGPLPIGDIIYGAGIVILVVVAVAAVSYSQSKSKEKSKEETDPYARPGQKKQGRENKNKSRQKGNFTPRNNRRDQQPAPPKKHTPGRDHRKFGLK